MKYNILDNGLCVLCHSMLNTHSITLGLYVKAGPAYGDEMQAGITHLLEHMHFRRLGNVSQEDLYYKMESIGSTLRAVTYRDFLKFSMKIIPDKLEDAIEIFKCLLETYEWDEDDIMLEKQVVKNQINSKGDYISIKDEVRNVIFKEHCLSNDIMGTVEDIDNITGQDIKKYKELIFNAQNMLFCITGNVSDNECQFVTEKLSLNTIPRTIGRKHMEKPKCFQRRQPDIVLIDVPDDNYLDVHMAFDVFYEEKTKDLVTVLNCILGEGVGSKLQKKVREEYGYTSDIASYMEWYQEFGVLHIVFSVEKKQILPCFEMIIKTVNQLKNTITKRDLDASLPFYTTNMVFCEDDTEEMNFQLAYHKLVLNCDYTPSDLQNEESTIIALQNLAREIFVRENMSIVIVGNRRGITKKSLRQMVEGILS